MLLTVATTAQPDASDFGYLLHKHPGRLQEFELSFGRAMTFYPEANAARCEAALHVEVGEVDRATDRRGRGANDSAYVSDRSHAAGSYLPSAIMRVFGTALTGRCDSRPGLAASAIPLEIVATPVACRSRATAADLFGPLGWEVEEIALPLDPAFPEWGDSPHRRIRLRGVVRLSEALRQVCVLLPVLDGQKHYYVADDEVRKLLHLGEGWLEGHPLRHLIVRRYLRQSRELVLSAESALADLLPAPDAAPTDDVAVNEAPDGEVPDDEAPGVQALGVEPSARPVPFSPPATDGRMGLQEARIAAAVARLKAAGSRRVADLGCGEGDLILALLADPAFAEVVGVEPSPHGIARASKRLERLPEAWRHRARLIQGAATYPDARLAGFDAFVLLEVIEHIDPWRLPLLEEAVFGPSGPPTVLLTTPNRDFNALFPGLEGGRLRHGDHRFEWGRDEFKGWADAVAARRGYAVETFFVCDEVDGLGGPTQGAAFTRAAST